MATTKWKIDPAHSEILFTVKHLMITNVTGSFREFDLELETEENNFATTKNIVFTANVDSITTNSEQRDTHLKSSDFFDVEKYRQLKFTGKRFVTDGDHAKLYGNLTIRDTTNPIVLDIQFGGMVVDPYGQTKAGFTVEGAVSRKEFGLTWNAVTEAGSVVVSDEIKIHADVQLIREAASQLAEHSG